MVRAAAFLSLVLVADGAAGAGISGVASVTDGDTLSIGSAMRSRATTTTATARLRARRRVGMGLHRCSGRIRRTGTCVTGMVWCASNRLGRAA